jgi:hypothetical protein
MSEESPLAGGAVSDDRDGEEERVGPSFGALKPNKKARGRRDKLKFFDSADWAMKNKDGQGTEDQGGQKQQGDVRYVPDAGESPPETEESPLAGK